jgi:signal transduction histidine kinase
MNHPHNGWLIQLEDDAKVGTGVYNVTMKTIKNLWKYINKYPLIGDGILTLLLGLWVFFNLRTYWATQPPPVNTVLAITLISLEIVPLIFRRVFPSIALLVITMAAVTLLALNIPDVNFKGMILMLAVFSASTYGGKRRDIISITCIASIIGGLIYSLILKNSFVGSTALLSITQAGYNLIIFLAVWWLGNTLRLSREQAAELKESTEQLIKEREENAHRAVVDERIRIARELHDVLAHHVSVMGIQAGAARQVFKQYPEKALNALNLIETSSRQAVAELYRLLDLLRDEKQAESFTAQPGLQQLDKLVDNIEAAWLHVEVKIKGQKRKLPQMADLSAYRIIEEGLTNVLKHAGATKAVIEMNYQNDSLLLTMSDNGHGMVQDPESSAGGRGLIGMRERVNLLKGDFWAGNGPDRGFLVRIKLPLDGQG